MLQVLAGAVARPAAGRRAARRLDLHDADGARFRCAGVVQGAAVHRSLRARAGGAADRPLRHCLRLDADGRVTAHRPGMVPGRELLTGIVVEIGRRLRTPAGEEPGVEANRAVWGRPKARATFAVALALAAVSATLAGRAVGVQWLVAALPPPRSSWSRRWDGGSSAIPRPAAAGASRSWRALGRWRCTSQSASCRWHCAGGARDETRAAAAQRPGCTTRSPWERAASARRAS